jgi:hypothetical protein
VNRRENIIHFEEDKLKEARIQNYEEYIVCPICDGGGLTWFHGDFASGSEVCTGCFGDKIVVTIKKYYRLPTAGAKEKAKLLRKENT